MKLLSDEQEEKDVYYKSFETDSFDLDDCFDGSTQPQNSSLLSNRLRERTQPSSSSRSGTGLPTPLVNDANKPTSSPANLSTLNPLKPPGFHAPLSSFLSNTRETSNDPANEVIKQAIKKALRDLLSSEPLG